MQNIHPIMQAALKPFAPPQAGRDFHVTVTATEPGGTSKFGYTLRFADAIDAACDGRERLGPRCGKVEVRPAIERTYIEGRARWPEPLHSDAFMEAFRGWTDAARFSGGEVPTRIFVVTTPAAQDEQLREKLDDEYRTGLDKTGPQWDDGDFEEPGDELEAQS